MFSCVRCSAPSSVLMSYSYEDRMVWLDDLAGPPDGGYALCGDHADRMVPPLKWTLSDRRRVTRLFAPLEVA